MMTLPWIVFFLVTTMVFSYQRASLRVWTVGYIAWFVFFNFLAPFPAICKWSFSGFVFAVFLILNISPLRRWLLSRHFLKFYKTQVPTMSDTERTALASGTVGWEAALFSGMPDWQALRSQPMAKLTAEEAAFLAGPVEQVCRMTDNWSISKQMAIPDAIWQRLKSDRFFGMIIPTVYGGLGFSPYAHAEVIYKLSGVSTALGTVVCVPNSLGPGELLLHFGTEEQKQTILPRLASGQDIPCFGLTSPVAGSDAGSIEDSGVVCMAEFEGEEQLCLRLNWNKRYITLAPVATLIGLAFKCYDPDHLLGDQTSLGITCALIPVQTPGVKTGRRHFPLHCAFPNGPTQGEDVIIPLRYVIGGRERIGQGWEMLMSCLAAGRAISLPAMVGANANHGLLTTTAYARIRHQFHCPISAFEGIQSVLARMTGRAVQLTALRAFTLSILNQGETPAIASAISKCHATELSRQIVNDAMDVQGGKGICMGPSNFLAQGYIEAPISITVEGANILTRSLMIYGQGALRAHPYLLKEMEAVQQADQDNSCRDFDHALFGHIGFMISNFSRSVVLGVTSRPAESSGLDWFARHLTRFSAVLAWLSDWCAMTLGASLKRREMLSSRLGQLLSLLYIGSAVLRYRESHRSPELEPMIRWVFVDLLYRLETTVSDIVDNLPGRIQRLICRRIVLPLGRRHCPPSDQLTRQVAQSMAEPGPARDLFSVHLHAGDPDGHGLANIEKTLAMVIRSAPLEQRLAQAIRDGQVMGYTHLDRITAAEAAGVLSGDDGAQLRAVHAAVMQIINVDDFSGELE